jgi:hypothetical protein
MARILFGLSNLEKELLVIMPMREGDRVTILAIVMVERSGKGTHHFAGNRARLWLKQHRKHSQCEKYRSE